MTSVLYDTPGPRAIIRNRVLSAVSAVGVVALLGWVVYRLYDTGQFESILWEQFQYKAVQQELLDGYLTTLKVAGISAVGALIFGAVFATGRLSDHWIIRAPATFIVELFRAIPLLVLIFFAFYLPLQYNLAIGKARTVDLGIFAFQFDPKMWALVVGLVLYNGSVLAEIFRAGILAVPKGQSEAAYAIGLRKTSVNRLILLPQAVRAMLPAIVSQLVVLLKDTALGFIINYTELLFVGKQIGGRLAFGLPYVPTYLIVAAIYIATCGLLSLLAYFLQRRLIRGRRQKTAAAPVPLSMDPGGGAAAI